MLFLLILKVLLKRETIFILLLLLLIEDEGVSVDLLYIAFNLRFIFIIIFYKRSFFYISIIIILNILLLLLLLPEPLLQMQLLLFILFQNLLLLLLLLFNKRRVLYINVPFVLFFNIVRLLDCWLLVLAFLKWLRLQSSIIIKFGCCLLKLS